jgi:MYXO-CTERM domain-containing protein
VEGQPFDDVQNTITHELGHVLGLMHSDTSADLVMYPSAPPGELTKRTLKDDDRDGLLSLYGTEPAANPAPLAMGCSATSTASGWGVLALVLLTLGRRKTLAVAALSLPALATAAEPSAITRADEVALVQVVSRQPRQHPLNRGLIITELSLLPLECLKGTCADLARVVVAGGRVGDIEQVVVHEPVPVPGQTILVTRSAGRVRVLWVVPAAQQEIVRALRAQSVGGVAPAPAPRSLVTP